MTQKLFAVYLGGRAEGCKTELHDVAFVTGATIEDTYEKLLEKWFGIPEGLHLDSWQELDIVDGHRVTLENVSRSSRKKLYFVNLGAYVSGQFGEVHASTFIVAESKAEAKKRGKAELVKGWPSAVHTDDLYDVDDCLEVAVLAEHFIVLEKTDEVSTKSPTNGFNLIPKDIVAHYRARSQI